MNILTLFDNYEQLLLSLLMQNPHFNQVEQLVNEVGDNLTADILVYIIETIDLAFRNSKERRDKYYIKDNIQRTIISLQGSITFNMTYYQEKKPDENGIRKCYSYITEYLGLPKYCKMTDSAEYEYVKCSIDTNMEYASKNAIKGAEISRQTLSRKILKYNTEQKPIVERTKNTPSTLYIEMDEVHCNLQSQKNKIVPAAVVHEGYKEEFVKRKQLLNKKYLASATLNYQGLWELIYQYCDQRYDLNKVEYLFISGDGASGIKNFDLQFPNAIYVLDKFHYRKKLNYIFKKEPTITSLADHYLRNKMFTEFDGLIDLQLNKYPNQTKDIIKIRRFLIDNIEGIINQNHIEYKCPCSMEGHISHKYARYITSRPFAFSIRGLTNKVQLLNIKANETTLDFDLFLEYKYGKNYDYYETLNYDDFKSEFKLSTKSSTNVLKRYDLDYNVTTPNEKFNERFLKNIEQNIKYIC